jgi:MFS family permease
VSPTFKSFRHRNYRLFWGGMFVSNIGTWMQRIAQDWLVLVVLGGGAQAVGISTGLQFLPLLLMAPFGGLLADKLPKRRLLMATNTFMGAVGLTLGVLVLTGTAEIWHVYVMAFLLGVGSAFDNPARQAFVSELVKRDDLPNAVALNAASFNGARMMGPAVAGLLIQLIGTGWVFMINAASFVAPVIALMLLRERLADPRTQSDQAGSAFSRLRNGVSYVRSRPDIVMVLFVMFGLGMFGMNLEMSIVLMATEVFGKGAGEYGVLGSILAVGSLSGALLAARRSAPRRRYIVGGAAIFGLLEIGAAFIRSYALFAVALVPLGIVAMTILTSANAYVQGSTPLKFRGRVMALYIMVLFGGKPIGAPIIGWLAEQFGAQWSLLSGGIVSIVFAIVAVTVFAPRSGVSVRPAMRPRPRLVVLAPQTRQSSDMRHCDGEKAA